VQGEFQRAIPVLERGMVLCQQWHLPGQVAQVTSLLGYAYALAGRPEDGIDLLEQAVNEPRGARGRVNESLGRTMLGEATLLAGRREAAAQSATRGLDIAV